jgi:glycosyltransferase involved in cell wall biosynthesis
MIEKISIVIPYHGRLSLFKETLESLRKQSFKDFEVVISDDTNDTENIKMLIDSYSDLHIKYVKSSINLGAISNTLQGINNASNNFIHILHTDDILSPNCIQFEQELINKYPGNLFINHIHHAFENEFYSNEHNEYKIECPKTSWLKSKIFTDCTVPSAWCFNKKILKDINFTKGEFAFVYDWNFLFSVLVYLYKNELTFIEIPQGYVGWREHSDSESTKGILTCFTEWKRLALLMANELQECGILNKKEIKRVLKKSEKCRIKRIIKDYEKNKKNFKLPQDVLFKYYWKLLLKFIYSKEKQPASHRIIYRILGFKISKKSTKNYKKCSIKNSKVPLIIDGDFYNLKNFPIKAKNYQLQSDAYTIPSLCIVIQGPIVKENDFTLETCKIYKKIFNNSETIILSTWDTEDKKYLKNFESIGVKVLLSKAPDFAGRANLNYQILSTMKGLEEGEKLGCEYAIKTRTDQRFYSTNLSRDLFNLLKIYPPSPNYNMHSRLIALSFNSFKYRYYGISDMFLFGNTQDMLKYWNSPLDTKKYEEYKTIKQKDLWQQYCSETYIASHFLKNIGVTPEFTLKHTWKIYKDLFIFIDKEILDMYWPKYTNLDSRWRLFRPNMLEEMRHSDWLNLYLNDDFFIKEDIELLIPNIGEN